MAVAVVGGLITSALLMLFIVPAMYIRIRATPALVAIPIEMPALARGSRWARRCPPSGPSSGARSPQESSDATYRLRPAALDQRPGPRSGTARLPPARPRHPPSTKRRRMSRPSPAKSPLHRITLTQRAAERLGIVIAAVDRGGGAGARVSVPYSAGHLRRAGQRVDLRLRGAPLVFVREAVIVEDVVPNDAAGLAVLARALRWARRSCPSALPSSSAPNSRSVTESVSAPTVGSAHDAPRRRVRACSFRFIAVALAGGAARLRQPAGPEHAGRRLPGVRAAARRDPDGVAGPVLVRDRGARDRAPRAGRCRASPGSTSCARGPSRSSPRSCSSSSPART